MQLITYLRRIITRRHDSADIGYQKQSQVTFVFAYELSVEHYNTISGTLAFMKRSVINETVNRYEGRGSYQSCFFFCFWPSNAIVLRDKCLRGNKLPVECFSVLWTDWPLLLKSLLAYSEPSLLGFSFIGKRVLEKDLLKSTKIDCEHYLRHQIVVTLTRNFRGRHRQREMVDFLVTCLPPRSPPLYRSYNIVEGAYFAHLWTIGPSCIKYAANFFDYSAVYSPKYQQDVIV